MAIFNSYSRRNGVCLIEWDPCPQVSTKMIISRLILMNHIFRQSQMLPNAISIHHKKQKQVKLPAFQMIPSFHLAHSSPKYLIQTSEFLWVSWVSVFSPYSWSQSSLQARPPKSWPLWQKRRRNAAKNFGWFCQLFLEPKDEEERFAGIIHG